MSLNPEFKMAFDPFKTEDRWMRKIVKNKPAFVLWCFIRRDHLVSQYFNEDIYHVGTMLRKRMPKTAQELDGLLLFCQDGAARKPWMIGHMPCYSDKDKARREQAIQERNAKLAELLEYIRGDKEIKILPANPLPAIK